MEDPFSSNLRFIASVSLNGTQRVLLGNGPNPCRDLLSGWKSDVAPSVRPWNACWATTMNGPLAPLRSDGLSCRSHQNFLAILSAVSTTSPPLDFVMMRTLRPTSARSAVSAGSCRSFESPFPVGAHTYRWQSENGSRISAFPCP